MPARSHPRRLIVALQAGGILLLGLLAAGAGPARAAGTAFSPGTCVTTPSTVVPGVKMADPACEFDGAAYTGPFRPIANGSGQLSRVWTGIASDGASYRIEVPSHWNGTLVMFAHGYRGTGAVVWVDDPQLRQYFVDHGFAWAASSYALNGYDPGNGVADTHDLLKAFPSVTGRHSRQVIMSGLSMGGEVTTAEIEAYQGDFAGAMPYCGVLAGSSLFDYYLGANVTAAALTKTTISYPTTLAAGQAYAPAYQTAVQSELPALGITPNPATGGQTFTTSLTKTGTLWADTVEQLSGGTRPGFASAVDYWDSFGFPPLTKVPFLFGVYPGLNGGTLGFANGSVAGNEHAFYTFSTDPREHLRQEIALNRAVLRVPVTATSSADALSPAELPVIHGDPGIPVLSVHGIGDLFVPFSMDQRYDAMMVAHGQGDLFVGRAIREVTHCGYTTSELSSAFSALVSWIDTGQRAAGDSILSPEAVASPQFGCRFTDPAAGAHPEFRARACCPPGSRHGHGTAARTDVPEPVTTPPITPRPAGPGTGAAGWPRGRPGPRAAGLPSTRAGTLPLSRLRSRKPSRPSSPASSCTWWSTSARSTAPALTCRSPPAGSSPTCWSRRPWIPSRAERTKAPCCATSRSASTRSTPSSRTATVSGPASCC